MPKFSNRRKEFIQRRSGKINRLLVTAGPTIEPIDPVRFLSNRSTGLIGYELAKLARKRGYAVTLISGPTALKPPNGVKTISIETSRQLQKKVNDEIKKNDILIMSSAVSDFRTANYSRDKIKAKKNIALRLVRNPDILASLSADERRGKIIAGFSLETKNLLKNAMAKLKRKKLDLIVANKITRSNNPFGKGKKTVYIFDRSGRGKKLEKTTKTGIARAILDTIKELCYTPN